MQSGVPTGSVRSNSPNNYEQGETSNCSRNYRSQKNKKTESFLHKREQNINEEFKQKSPLLLETIPTQGYDLNLDCVTNKRKALDTGRTFVVLALTQEPIYAIMMIEM